MHTVKQLSADLFVLKFSLPTCAACLPIVAITKQLGAMMLARLLAFAPIVKLLKRDNCKYEIFFKSSQFMVGTWDVSPAVVFLLVVWSVFFKLINTLFLCWIPPPDPKLSFLPPAIYLLKSGKCVLSGLFAPQST